MPLDATNDMTKIDFHILPTIQENDVFHYVARLVQKAMARQHQVLVATSSAEQALAVSDAIWACSPESFMTHTLIDQPHYPLQISHNHQCGEHHDVLINLCAEIPEYFSRFERIFEVVCQQPQWLSASRDHYRFYQDHRYAIDRHDLRERA